MLRAATGQACLVGRRASVALLAGALTRPLSSGLSVHRRPAPLASARARHLSGGRGVWGFMDAVKGKTMIGKDRHGNTYWQVKNPGGNPDPKREIDYNEKQMVSAFAASLLAFHCTAHSLHLNATRLHASCPGAAGPDRVLHACAPWLTFARNHQTIFYF